MPTKIANEKKVGLWYTLWDFKGASPEEWEKQRHKSIWRVILPVMFTEDPKETFQGRLVHFLKTNKKKLSKTHLKEREEALQTNEPCLNDWIEIYESIAPKKNELKRVWCSFVSLCEHSCNIETIYLTP